MVGSLEAADLFLRGHTQEPYVYENAKMRINLAHPALPMVNLVQPVVARKFYGNQTLNENGVTARFVPYFHLDAAPATQRFNLEVSLEAYNAKITQLLQMFYTQDRAAQRYRVGVIPAALRLVHRFEDVVRSDVIPYMPEAAEPYLRKAHDVVKSRGGISRTGQKTVLQRGVQQIRAAAQGRGPSTWGMRRRLIKSTG